MEEYEFNLTNNDKHDCSKRDEHVGFKFLGVSNVPSNSYG